MGEKNRPSVTLLPEVTLEECGLTKEEYERAKEIFGREPNRIELRMVGALWSEHCSYKSSRIHLKELPTTGPDVIQGPGENAGIVRLSEEYALAFKMESHNHPSYIEPYQGAATGVGGILRDIFAMGARPILLLNSLRFPDPENPNTPHFVDGVVRGIGDYGNSVGVPTVGGETYFYPSYSGNILVNAMTVGIVPRNKILRSAPKTVGASLFLIGNRTGRDGVFGAVMASDSFEEDWESKRVHVQIGDPFVEKIVLEAVLQMADEECLEALQDLGAAGLTSSSVEMSAKGGVGVSLYLDRVPLREKGMSPEEILLSESQERMLLVAKKGKEKRIEEICNRWEIPYTIIGEVISDPVVRVWFRGEVVAEIPTKIVREGSPSYLRPFSESPHREKRKRSSPPLPEGNPLTYLPRLFSHPNLGSKRWIFEQYDSTVQGNTILGPGGDAQVVWIPEAQKAIAVTVEGNSRYVEIDPYMGVQHIVTEGVRNLLTAGAITLGITDCLNFGNPENPHVMWEFIQVIQGMKKALQILKIPVVSGNVSFYNENKGKNIWPTPILGFVGRVEIDPLSLPRHYGEEKEIVYLIGTPKRSFSGSLSAYLLFGSLEGTLPTPDYSTLSLLKEFLFTILPYRIIGGIRDISDGGVLCTLVEFLFPKTLGITLREDLPPDPIYWYGEGGENFLVSIPPDKEEEFIKFGRKFQLPMDRLGVIKGKKISYLGEELDIEELKNIYESALPRTMEGKPV